MGEIVTGIEILTETSVSFAGTLNLYQSRSPIGQIKPVVSSEPNSRAEAGSEFSSVWHSAGVGSTLLSSVVDFSPQPILPSTPRSPKLRIFAVNLWIKITYLNEI